MQDFLQGVALDRTHPLRDQIYAIVRRAIVTGTLPPGAVIDEVEIAERLGLSRTPVREAVKKISDEGLVDVRAQSGTYVAEINRASVEEAYIVRIALECESVARAAPLMNADHLRNFEDIIGRHSAALRGGRFDEAIACDDEFHRYITQISGLTTLWKMVDTCKAQMDRCRILTVPRPGHGTRTIEQHRAILVALVARKPRPAIAALRAHLDTSLDNSLTWFAERDKAR
jgi:GntR family transcriptional regulator, rspAB operon transcriptional repressor